MIFGMSDALDQLFQTMAQPDRRKRARGNGGGWKGAQASIDALHAYRDAARAAVKARQCERCGRQPAVTGSRFCRHHGGWNSPHYRARLRPEKAIRSRVVQAEKAGAIPRELLMHPAYQALRYRGGWRAGPLLGEMVQAWVTRETNPAAWGEVLRKVREAGYAE